MGQLIAFHRNFGSFVLGPPEKDYFFAVPWRGSFGRILTMQLEPPKNGNPRSFYKYLGTYFFNQRQNTQMYQLLVNTINSFFTNLSTLPLTHNKKKDVLELCPRSFDVFLQVL